MEIRFNRRVRVALVICTLLSLGTDGAAGALLLRYDFDDLAGNFELVPEFADPAIATATWSDDFGTLTEFAGNPGRALATNGFTNGNALHLALSLQPGFTIALEGFRFDLRASPSGPTSWQLAVNGGTFASGVVTTAFETVDVALALAGPSPGFLIDIDGAGATSAAGTLRLDNVELTGSVSAVTLPTGFYLFATPLIGIALNRIGARVRCGRGAAPAQGRSKGHSRQASSKGK
jgi:hypothetical protein